MEPDNTSPQDNPDLNEWQKKNIQQQLDTAAFEKKVELELKSEERFRNYFAGFNEDSVKRFITSYAQKKAFWHRFGDFWTRQNEAEDLQWINEAENHLACIQQKKLFDVQCLWRAEKITLPGIEICFDFVLWEKDIMSCHFIEPVTESDIELYLQYLGQNNVDLQMRFFSGWQDYEELKADYNSEDGGCFPEWYDFHNGRTGASAYMLLPDIRGEKETFYDDLAREKARPETEAKQAEWDKVRDKRPFMKSIYDKEFMAFFVSTFEDKKTQEYYKADLRYNRSNADEEQINDNIKLLLKAGEPISIEAHYDWKQAIENATERYRIRKIAEFLPAAFEQYQLNRSMGILPANPEGRNSYLSIRESWAKWILDGREINGEPRDFNF